MSTICFINTYIITAKSVEIVMAIVFSVPPVVVAIINCR